MRINDWSSDVCSSDLQAGTRRGLFGSIHGSTGSSRGRGRGPRLWRLRAGSAERPRRGGGGRTVSRTQCSRPSSRRLSMNIGSIKQNEGGIFVGKIETLTIAMTIALREVNPANQKERKTVGEGKS